MEPHGAGGVVGGQRHACGRLRAPEDLRAQPMAGARDLGAKVCLGSS